jgi:hypothetical protein
LEFQGVSWKKALFARELGGGVVLSWHVRRTAEDGRIFQISIRKLAQLARHCNHPYYFFNE